MRLSEVKRENFRLTRLRSRFRPPPSVFDEVPERPIGVKLELTYACNLRCAFCYTDSPRRTLQRSTDLGEDAWRRIVDEALGLGIVEAVVTGGEPLLRRELALEVIGRLADEGVGVAFNTNGWFVDEGVVEALSRTPNVTVHLSVDGAAPHLHDGARGVPGSWRRAIEGLDRLIGAGVNVCVVHVITPDNEAHFGAMLERMWMLGVSWMRPTPVVVTGAAARGGEWKVDYPRLQRTIKEFEARRGTTMKVDLRAGTAGDLANQGLRPPASMLIRPNGAARVDSLRPFSYGNAATEGVATCWSRIRSGWRDERVEAWAGALGDTNDMARGDLVPYLDDEVPVAGAAEAEHSGGRRAPVPARTPPKTADPLTDLSEAESLVRDLAFRRRYRLERVRAGGGEETIVRRTADGGYLRLNRAATAVMRALDGGTPHDAATRLRDAVGAPANRAEDDALRATRDLLARRIVAPAGSAPGRSPQVPGSSDLPGMEPVGEER